MTIGLIVIFVVLIVLGWAALVVQPAGPPGGAGRGVLAGHRHAAQAPL